MAPRALAVGRDLGSLPSAPTPRPLSRHLCPRAECFTPADCDRLLAARDPLAGTARPERATFLFVHRTFHFLTRFPPVLRHQAPRITIVQGSYRWCIKRSTAA